MGAHNTLKLARALARKACNGSMAAAPIPAGGVASVPNVLAVAGSDSSAGAGIQADLKTLAALRVYGCTAVTAVTAQNSVAVQRVAAVSAAMVEAQMESVLADVRISAVKIGMLPNARIVRVVARVLERHGLRNVVYDPVMAASTGGSLQGASALRALRTALLPRVTVITPNAAELARLAGRSALRGDAEIDRAARQLLDAGPAWVLVTGGDRPGRESRDRLHGPFAGASRPARAKWYRALRIVTRHGHGTGCTLSSAIAARLAFGDRVPEAVRTAKVYLGEALATAGLLHVGKGAGPLNHFVAPWRQT